MKISRSGHQKVMTVITTKSVRKEMSVTAPETQTGNPSRTARTPGNICLPGSSPASSSSWQPCLRSTHSQTLAMGCSSTLQSLQVPPHHAFWCPCFCPFPKSSLLGSFYGELCQLHTSWQRDPYEKVNASLCWRLAVLPCVCGFLFSPKLTITIFLFFSFLSEWYH